MTYYKYAERNVASEINWAEVGKDLTDMLKNENKIREDKKAAIDEASRKFGEELANAPTGESQSASAWSLKYGADASEYLLMQDRLLKSGQLKLKDYTVMRQNLVDGTNLTFDLIKEYQEQYKKADERYKNNESSAAEWSAFNETTGFLNFAETKPYINPTTGQISIAKMRKNAQGVDEMSGDFMTVNDLRNRMKTKVDKYNYDKNLQGWVDTLGEFQAIESARGGWNSVTNPQLRTTLDPVTKTAVNEFDKALNLQIDSMLANEWNTASVLVDQLSGYSITYDEKVAASDPNKVLMKKGGPNMPFAPDFSGKNGAAQLEKAKDFLRAQSIVKLTNKTEYKQKTVNYEPEYIYKGRQKAEAEQQFGNIAGQLHSGNDTQVESAVGALRAMKNVNRVERDGNGIHFSFNDPQEDGTVKTVTKYFSFYDGSGNRNLNMDEFVISIAPAIFGKEVELDNVLSGARKYAKNKFNSTAKAKGAATYGVSPYPNEPTPANPLLPLTNKYNTNPQ